MSSAKTKDSAEGGRAGWKGLRFEAAFAVLNLVKTSLSQPPLGLDKSTKVSADAAAGAAFQFQPQADGAVDDLVALQGAVRVVAYQHKSGLGQLPRSSTGESPTQKALAQAAAELTRADGAEVVVLVFGRLSAPLRKVARWLDDVHAPALGKAALRVLCDFFKASDSEFAARFRSRLRIVEFGEVSDIGAQIDLELTGRYASPQIIRSVADTLRELVSEHSDIEGASKGPITHGTVEERLASRDLPALPHVLQGGRPLLERLAEQFLVSVLVDRGPLPRVDRDHVVADVDKTLNVADVVLLGPGGAGKSEVLAQLLEHRLSMGWTPVVIRRQDLAASATGLAELVGGGGRFSVPDVLRNLVTEGRNVLLVVDALDEIRRGAPTTSTERCQEVYRLLTQVRDMEPTRARLQMVVSSRTSDWSYFSRVPRLEPFQEFTVPALDLAALTEQPEDGVVTVETALLRLAPELRAECLRKPLLLRFAFELALSGDVPTTTLVSDAELWRLYYERCVTAVDDIPARGFSDSDVHRCHDVAALAHLEGDDLYTSIPDGLLRSQHDPSYRWLQSLDVLRVFGGHHSAGAAFFSTSYLDFALANSLQDQPDVLEGIVSSANAAAVMQPVLQLLASFWRSSSVVRARERTLRLLERLGHLPSQSRRCLKDGSLNEP